MALHELYSTGSRCPNSPFVQFHLTDGVDVRQERLQGLRMRLEEVEERHGPEGLGGRPDLVPRPFQDRLLFRSQHFLERVALVWAPSLEVFWTLPGYPTRLGAYWYSGEPRSMLPVLCSPLPRPLALVLY